MNEPSDHHYLPVFYLSQWCNDEGKIIRYYRPHKAVVASPITPKHTGYEPHLYSLPGHPPGKEQTIETDFMAKVIDDPASRALTVLTAGDASRMTDELRIAWTRFLMAMNLRSPHSLADTTTLARDIVRTNLGANLGEEFVSVEHSDEPPSAYSRLESDAPHFIGNLGKLFLPGLIDNGEIAYYLSNMRWVVLGLHHSEFTLLVGDGPFIRTHGLKDRECIVAVPIGPKLLFVASNSKDRQAGLRRFADTKIATAVNVNTVGLAVQHVYGRDRSHLQFVENRLHRRADLP